MEKTSSELLFTPVSTKVQLIKSDEDCSYTLRPSIVCLESIDVNQFLNSRSNDVHRSESSNIDVDLPTSESNSTFINSPSHVSSFKTQPNNTSFTCSIYSKNCYNDFDHAKETVSSKNEANVLCFMSDTCNKTHLSSLVKDYNYLSSRNFTVLKNEFEHDPARFKYVYQKCEKLRYPVDLAIEMGKLINPVQLNQTYELSSFTNVQGTVLNDRRLPDQGYLEIDGSHFSSNLQIVHPSEKCASKHVENGCSNKPVLTKARLCQINIDKDLNIGLKNTEQINPIIENQLVENESNVSDQIFF